MAAQQSQAQFLANLKSKTKGAYTEAKKVEAQVKGGRVPAGIDNGIARLIGFKYGATQEKKDPYIAITGMILEPGEHAGLKVPKTYFLTATKTKTVEEKFADFCNDAKLISGVDELPSLDDLQKFFQEMIDGGLCYKFQTWAGKPTKEYPNPQTNVTIVGKSDITDDRPMKGTDDDNSPADATQVGHEDAGADTNGWAGPQAGVEVYGWRPNSRAKIEAYDIVDVDSDARTCTIKNQSTGKEHKGISWDALLDAPE